MTSPSESYLKVQYDLRPAKQIERRMLIEALHLLALAGFQINDYQYTGLGSIYFVDFILFHKLLGISRMLSVEHSTKITKRVKFNKPYDCIELAFEPIGDVIPRLSTDTKHLLWLDYDGILERYQLDDLYLACSRLPPGSIILITIDVEPPAGAGPAEWKSYFEEEAERFLPTHITQDSFVASNLHRLQIQILEKVISSGLSTRPEVEFLPMFNFLYADGHQMLTIGGMIGTKAEARGLRSSKLHETSFMRANFDVEPFEILIPRLTRKERLYLDAAMPCTNNWRPRAFELESAMVDAYREIYRYFPAYAELLL